MRTKPIQNYINYSNWFTCTNLFVIVNCMNVIGKRSKNHYYAHLAMAIFVTAASCIFVIAVMISIAFKTIKQQPTGIVLAVLALVLLAYSLIALLSITAYPKDLVIIDGEILVIKKPLKKISFLDIREITFKWSTKRKLKFGNGSSSSSYAGTVIIHTKYGKKIKQKYVANIFEVASILNLKLKERKSA